MTGKYLFSAIALSGIVFMFSVSDVSAQRVRTITGSATGRVGTKPTETVKPAGNEFGIHSLVNSERRRRGVSLLNWNESLAEVARDYSRQMARESFFSHEDRNGNSVVDRVKAADIENWNKIGENLFFCDGYDDYNSLAVRGWLESPTHRRNMLDSQFTETGIGVARTRDGKVYVTQVFIRRK